MEDYFYWIENEVKKTYKIAEEARKKGFDPDEKIEIPLARNMAERVEGIISVVAPQIKESGVVDRFNELENIYGKLDWRVALIISLEVAQEKFCKFKDKREAMEIGIRVGLAYLTLGVVSSPLEGFTELKIKNRKDGKEYFCLMFSGPIRSAGTTVVCGSIVVADYIRKNMNYDVYDPTDQEVKRMVTELYDYHDRVSNLQYLPSEEEINFLVKNLPVQIDGEPSEEYEVSNYKDLERINTNRIRNGPCLVLGEAVAQKASKLWAQLQKWKKDFGLENWDFISEFLVLQKKIKSKGKSEEKKAGINPDFTYIKDLPAGRPVLGHPLAKGGLRLRYGRCRTSGLSSLSISPVTMNILNDYIGTGTQLRYERPGKSTAVQPCDTIEGPIIKLKDGSVLFLEDEEEAKKVSKYIEEILFLGDILINYGEFFNRAHVLVPCGYNEEWYCRELEKALGKEVDINEIRKISFEQALKISLENKIPMHPRYTFHFGDINKDQYLSLLEWFGEGKFENDGIISPLRFEVEEVDRDPKRTLELLGVPHKVLDKKNVLIEGDWAKALKLFLLDKKKVMESNKEIALDIINELSEIKIRDKSGTFIGARMGRPEKAKMRKLDGSPHVLFPVGKEGGRLRCFQAALEIGSIKSQFPTYYCENCKNETISSICEECGNKCVKKFYCGKCGKTLEGEKCNIHGKTESFRNKEINIKNHFKFCLNKLGLREYPALVKGVRGTSNKDHIPENLAKGILRAINKVYVNKDGTIRYDVTEMAITHFRAREIGVNIEKLKKLGYEKDIYGNEIIDDEQLIEIKPQDIILPCCKESPDEGADVVLFRVANFVDDSLEKFYGLNRFYNLKNKEDLVGHLVIGIAPHTSAAIIGRIIGFSNTQGLYAHPLWHSAQRRDCFSYDTNIPIYDGNCWKNVKIGEFVEDLKPDKVVDSFGTLSKDVDNYKTLAYNTETKKMDVMPIKWFTKHTPRKLLNIKLENGRELKVTENHKFYVYKDKAIEKRAYDLSKEDRLIIPYNYDIPVGDVEIINVEEYFRDMDHVRVKYIQKYVKEKINELEFSNFCSLFGVNKNEIYNYIHRDSFPISLVNKTLKYFGEDWNDLPICRKLGVKRNFVEFPIKVNVDKELMQIIGIYIAEGCARIEKGDKGCYQVDFAIYEKDVREKIKKLIFKKFGLKPNKNGGREGLTYSSRLFYEFFINILKTGKGAHTKRIPNMFLNLPKEKLSYLLRAYFEGDGCVSLSDRRVSCDTVSKGLIYDLELVFSRFGIYLRKYEDEREPGRKVKEFYIRKNREIPKFKSTKLVIPSDFCKIFFNEINFISNRKRNILEKVLKNIKSKGMKIEHDEKYAYLKIVDIKELNEETTYCLNVPGHHNVIANGIIAKQCEGDETSIILLMDVLLNFSKKYLPAHRGATQDAPLVITSRLVASEVDDMVFDMDISSKYPLKLYEYALQYKNPREVKEELKIEQVKDRLGKENQYFNYGFTHDTFDINGGVRCSAYKTIPTMAGKVNGQMDIAEKIRAVDEADVARLVIERHFIRDIKGNLRQFSMQSFRCVNCNEIYRRPPLIGKCLLCNGKIIFTVAEGSIIKYLELSFELAKKYNLPAYLKQTLFLTKQRIESIFGKDREKQVSIANWFG